MKRYLVTGAAGFIGSHLMETLLKQGHYVVGLDNLEHGSLDNLPFLDQYNASQYRFIKGDIRDKDCCLDATTNINFVLHQAALGSVPRSLEFPELYEDNNVKGTLTLLQAARKNKVSVVVQASSSSVYGDTPTLPKVETMIPNPKSPYALSKLACEHYGNIFTQHYGLPVISLRYFNVFGPRQNPRSQYAAVIPKFVTAMLNNQAPTIYGNGEQTRDFTYIDNVIQANINGCTASKEAHGKAFNIGGHANISVNTLAQKIKTLLKANCTFNYLPPRTGDVKDSLADIQNAQTLLNYSNNTNTDTGLQHTIEWYKTQVTHAT